MKIIWIRVLTVLVICCYPGCPGAALAHDNVHSMLPTFSQEQVESNESGQERPIEEAITRALPEQKEAVRWLIDRMPTRDLRALSSDYIFEHIKWAYQARRTVPWGEALPEALFLNYVLPYASINERRDSWRQDFYEKCLPLIKDCQTPGEAAVAINKTIWETVGVKYSTARPKPDQSPYESIEVGLASCTGLSVLLIDACRSVCVPARFVGIPQWANKPGNHSWVEVWDKGRWHCLGAAEPGPLGETWFLHDAAQADRSNPDHCIYATSFEPTGLTFPCIWNEEIQYVHAVDVTTSYCQNQTETSSNLLMVDVFTAPGGSRVSAKVLVFSEGKLCGEGLSRDEGSDRNDMLSFELEASLFYELEIKHSNDRLLRKKVGQLSEPVQKVEVFLDQD